jgi:hypothetical protein
MQCLRGTRWPPNTARSQRAVSALWSKWLCTGGHESPQLMCMSLDGIAGEFSEKPA